MARALAIHRGHPRLRLDRRGAAGVIRTLDAARARFRGGCPDGELSLAFLTDAALARLHADFLHDPSPTDVITFAGDSTLGVAGEICISVDAAMRQARRHPGRASDFSAELTLYLVHGWLHLAGYDDLRPAQKRLMRAAEARALKLLRVAGHLHRFRLA